MLFLIWGLSGSESVLAQSQSDGSIYSRFGIGERLSFFSSKSQAMGGGGYALASTQYANFSNPASLSDQFYTRFSGGLIYESINARADGVPEGRLASGALSGVNFSFPLRSNRTGIGFSFAPFSRVSYRVDIPSNLISDPDTGDISPVLTSFKGNGGLQKFMAGIGHRVSNNLNIGASVDVIFGILEETQRSTFNSALFVDRSFVKSTRLYGMTATGGFKYSVPGMPSGKALVFGGTMTLPTTMQGTRTLAISDASDRDTLGTAIKGEVSFPLGIGFGLAFQPEPRWTIISDVKFENWSSFSSDFDLPGYSATGESGVSNRLRLSAGAEFWPAARRPFAPWSARIAYRLGLYTDQSYISPDPGEKIRSFGITGGFSLPSLVPGTTIDFNLDVGRRGTTSNGLIQERYIRFGLNVNFGERWFERPPLG